MSTMITMRSSAWELVVGEGGVDATQLVGALVKRPGARARWLADEETRRRANLDWTQVTSGALHDRVLMAALLGQSVIALRISPWRSSVSGLWDGGGEELRQELEEQVLRTTEEAVERRLAGRGVQEYLGVLVLHPTHWKTRRSELHVHMLLLEASAPLRGEDLSELEDQGA